MKRFALTICLAACLVFALGSIAFATSSVTVESKNSFEGSPDAVGLFVTNDVIIRSITLPIVIRDAGTYPTTLTGEYVSKADGGRIGLKGEGTIDAIMGINYLDNEDGTCKQGQPGGFGTITIAGPDANSSTAPSPSDPDEFSFNRARIVGGDLAVGSDGATASIRILYTCPAGGPYGDFLIDTTCNNPAGHFLFVNGVTGTADPATFTAGTVTCNANACPGNLTGTDPVNATVGSPASNQIGGTDPEGDPIEFFKVSGPGTVGLTSGLWSYTPTCGDFPGFDVVIEVTDKGEGGCGSVFAFHVNVAPTPVVAQCSDVSVHWGAVAAQTVTASGGCSPYVFGGGAPGAVDGVSGDWTYATSCGDLGTVGVTVTVDDGAGQSVNCNFDLTVTNTAPTCNDLPDWTAPTSVPFSLVLGPLADADGDALTYTLQPGAPAWVAINGNLLEGSRPPGEDAPAQACWVVDDGCESSAACCVNLLFESAFIVCFDDGDNDNGQDSYVHTLGGRNVDICVWVDPTTGSSEGVGGFDFLICYDNSGLTLVNVMRGPDLHPDWEYFTWRTGMFGGNCTGACPDGFIRLLGITDMNNGITPDPAAFSLRNNVICLTFYVTADQNFTESCFHVGFCSYDCGDNTISSKDGYTLFLPNSGATFGPDYDFEACLLAKPDHFAEPFIDFCVGAICIDTPPDDRGDININGIANEVADAVLFSNYFMYGPSVWDPTWFEVQIFATDVNNDGLTLTIADLVYLIRIITGDEAPFPGDNQNPKVSPYANAVDVLTDVRNGSMTVSTNASVDLGGALLVYRYSNLTVGEAQFNAEGMATKSRASNGELRIVIYPDAAAEGSKISSGHNDLVTIPVEGNGTIELVESQFSDANGALLSVQAAKLAPPTSYALHQNFPNPFNAGTVIPLSLKNDGEWNLTVYNVAGQVVKTFAGNDAAGTINVRWDGRGDNGESVASGMYFYRATADEFTATKKMVVLK